MVNGHDTLIVLPKITALCQDKNQSNGEVNMFAKVGRDTFSREGYYDIVN